MQHQCGHITINRTKGKIIECYNEAKWESPERLRTSGKLKVCHTCKYAMEKDYRLNGVEPCFTKL